MMIRTPNSSRKRLRTLEESTDQGSSAILPLPDEERPYNLEVFRHRPAQRDKEQVSKLQTENTKLVQQLQAAEASSREFEVRKLPCRVLKPASKEAAAYEPKDCTGPLHFCKQAS